MKSKQIGAIVLAGLLVGGVASYALLTKKIKPGYVGVIYSVSGGVQNEVLMNGRKVVWPWQDLTQYSVSTEQVFLSADTKEGEEEKEDFDVTSKDGKKINVDIQYAYRFDAERVPEIFKRFKGKQGKDIESTYIKANAKVVAAETMSKFTVFDAYGEKRGQVNTELFKALKENFAKDGIIIESASFTRLGLDDSTNKAIQETVNKQQEIKTAELAKKKAEIEQSQKNMEAEAAAKRKQIEADAEAKANQTITNSLTPQLLEKMEKEARIKHGWIEVQGAAAIVKDR